jgi:LPXTG-site transpeptidase (sortase) family protein
MGKLAAAVAAAVIGVTLGVGLVVVLSDWTAPQPVSGPASLATNPPEEPLPSTEPAAPSPSPSPSPEPVAEPVRVVIPAIDVDSELVALGLNDDNSMEVPNFGLAGWYEPGPPPGAPGPAVIAAHVDSRRGPDVFFRLRELAAGDEVVVEQASGENATFVVDTVEQHPKDELPVERIWEDTDDVVLRLITCGGEFDSSVRSYRSNVIVYASAS